MGFTSLMYHARPTFLLLPLLLACTSGFPISPADLQPGKHITAGDLVAEWGEPCHVDELGGGLQRWHYCAEPCNAPDYPEWCRAPCGSACTGEWLVLLDQGIIVSAKNPGR